MTDLGKIENRTHARETSENEWDEPQKHTAQGRQAEPQREEGAKGRAEARYEGRPVHHARDGEEEQEHTVRHL